MLKVKVEKRFFYYPEDIDCFRCKLIIYLPCEDSLALNKLLRDATSSLFCRTLDEWWGTLDDSDKTEKFRYKHTVIESSQSWEDLNNKVENEITKIISLLQEIIKKNSENLNAKPKNEIKEFILQ